MKPRLPVPFGPRRLPSHALADLLRAHNTGCVDGLNYGFTHDCSLLLSGLTNGGLLSGLLALLPSPN